MHNGRADGDWGKAQQPIGDALAGPPSDSRRM